MATSTVSSFSVDSCAKVKHQINHDRGLPRDPLPKLLLHLAKHLCKSFLLLKLKKACTIESKVSIIQRKRQEVCDSVAHVFGLSTLSFQTSHGSPTFASCCEKACFSLEESVPHVFKNVCRLSSMCFLWSLHIFTTKASSGVRWPLLHPELKC